MFLNWSVNDHYLLTDKGAFFSSLLIRNYNNLLFKAENTWNDPKSYSKTTSLKLAVRSLMKSDRLAEPSFSYTHTHMHTHAPLALAPQKRPQTRRPHSFWTAIYICYTADDLGSIHERLHVLLWEAKPPSRNLPKQTKKSTFISQAIFNVIPGSSQGFIILFCGEYLHSLNSSLRG